MQGVLTVFVLLCVGVVRSSIPVAFPDICYRQFGPYKKISCYLTPQPVTIRGTQYFYHQCYYNKPSYSKCTGSCSSYQQFNTDPSSTSTNCQCCKARRCQVVPVRRVYCKYIFAYNGCGPPTVRSGWVYATHPTEPTHPAISRLRYFVADDCRCSTCRQSGFITTFPAKRVDSDVPQGFQGLTKVNVESEADVEGLGAPPTVVATGSLDQSVIDQQKRTHPFLLGCFGGPGIKDPDPEGPLDPPGLWDRRLF